MGQGLYMMLGYGVLAPPQLDDEDRQENFYGALDDLGLHMAYETTPDYLAIPVAVDEGCLQDWWELPDLPDMIPHLEPRTAHAVVLDHAAINDVLAAMVRAKQLAGRVPRDLRATWQEAQRLYAEAGLTLGEPGYVVINDWH